MQRLLCTVHYVLSHVTLSADLRKPQNFSGSTYCKKEKKRKKVILEDNLFHQLSLRAV